MYDDRVRDDYNGCLNLLGKLQDSLLKFWSVDTYALSLYQISLLHIQYTYISLHPITSPSISMSSSKCQIRSIMGLGGMGWGEGVKIVILVPPET